MNQPLSAARCFIHASREAIGKCKGCSQHYCRECLADVQGRLTCAKCMKLEDASGPKRFQANKMLSVGWFFLGFFALWLVFFTLGRLLLSIPEAYHASFF